MERTGHRSLDGVHSYKRTSTEQQEPLSDILAMVPTVKKHSNSDPIGDNVGARLKKLADDRWCCSRTIRQKIL